MAKILTDKEMADIVQRAVNDPAVVECTDGYTHFLEDLGTLICTHFGGGRGSVSLDEGDGMGWTCGFHINECVPDDGGVFKRYDTDVTWLNGKEGPGMKTKKATTGKCTKGTWKVHTDGGKTFVASTTGRVVAVDLYDENTGTPIEEVEANARLIAAAPTMLNLLLKMVELIEGSCGWNDTDIFPEDVYGTIGEALGEEGWRS